MRARKDEGGFLIEREGRPSALVKLEALGEEIERELAEVKIRREEARHRANGKALLDGPLLAPLVERDESGEILDQGYAASGSDIRRYLGESLPRLQPVDDRSPLGGQLEAIRQGLAGSAGEGATW